MKLKEGDIVQHIGLFWSDGTVTGKGRLYRIKDLYDFKFFDKVIEKTVIQKMAVIRSIKEPRWQLSVRTKNLTLVREAD